MTNEDKVEEILKHVLTETQVEFFLSQLKKDKTKHTLDDLSQIYIDVKHTFHYLMCKLGQMQTYEHIMELYQDYTGAKFLKNTVMKLLVRCINGYTSIEKINKIFKMIKRHNRLFSMLEVKEKLKAKKAKKSQINAFSDKKKTSKDKTKNEKTEAEAKVAYFCMHACRLYTLIRSFHNECLHVVN